MITVRRERPEDILLVRKINWVAFGQPPEAEIVDRLREDYPEALSLVAEEEGQIVGHILFTPVEVETGNKVIWGMGLAPMAVLPETPGFFSAPQAPCLDDLGRAAADCLSRAIGRAVSHQRAVSFN